MIRYLLSLLFFTSVVIGHAQRYAFVKYSELRLNQLELSHTMYLPISSNEISESGILDTTYLLLSMSKENKLRRYLRSLEEKDRNSPDLYLAIAILNFYSANFYTSKQFLSKIKSNEYMTLKTLLELDIEREMSMIENRPDFEYFLIKYQRIVDNNPGNLILKKIIDIRIRFLRYDE